jgi:hypothetical protein
MLEGMKKLLGSKHTNQGEESQKKKTHWLFETRNENLGVLRPKEEVRNTIPIYKLHKIISSRGTQTKRSF